MEHDSDPAAPDRYRAPALDKGLDILEVLSDQPGGLTRSEIVKALGLSPSQIYRMLERLVARGYVARLDGGDRYALSMRMFLVATRHPPLRRLVAQAQPGMDDFARAMRQSCHLIVPEQGVGIVVAQASPTGHWEFRARLGGQIDLFATGSGQTLLAFQPPERLVETLGVWGVAPGPAQARLTALRPHLARIRDQRARIGPSPQLVGVTDISIPVPGPDGSAIAALTCAYIAHPDATDGESPQAALEGLRAIALGLAGPGRG
ncbi:MAG: IclR family transcriptional regulator [Paracoccus sp. (in: a-proteobacteria)]|uniref:IclR family transcriptional regulator n=1 Tax=Paracoccus sp. TaxID=267 RepID=UPI0039E7068F